MSIDILTLAFDLSDHDLLARLGTLAGHEREVTAELVARLAALAGAATGRTDIGPQAAGAGRARDRGIT